MLNEDLGIKYNRSILFYGAGLFGVPVRSRLRCNIISDFFAAVYLSLFDFS